MLKRGDIGTEIDRKPFLFTLIAAAGSTAAAVLLFVLGRGSALSVFSGILVGIVAAAAWIILFVMLTDYAYVDGQTLRTRYLFRKESIAFSEIEKVTCREKVYYVFNREGNVAATINGQLTGIDGILYAMEKNGVRFE